MPSGPPTPPSRTTIPMYHRSHSSHDAARSSHLQPNLHKVDQSQTTAATPIPGAAARPKNQTASSKTRRPSRQPRRTGDTRLSPKPCKQQVRPMSLLPTMVPEAAASTYKHHSGLLPRHPPTEPTRQNRKGARVAATKVRPPRQRLQGGIDETIADVVRSGRTVAWAFARSAPDQTTRKAKASQ
jgi:hypothetical protein